MPGVSIRAPPAGSSMSSRWLVVWRPRLSDSRTSAVRRRSSPIRRFTSDDLPTPDDPTSASVRPTARYGRSGSMPSGLRVCTATTGAAPARAAASAIRAATSPHRSLLIQHYDRGGAALHAQREVALQAAKVEIAIQPADQEHQVDVK